MTILEFVLNNNDYLEDLITRSTYHSNAIEGSTLTYAETYAILYNDNSFKIEGKEPREIYEAINHKKALELVFKNLQNDDGFDERFIKKLNETINRDIKDTEGYRTVQVFIRGSEHIPPAPEKIPNLMTYFVYNYNAYNTCNVPNGKKRGKLLMNQIDSMAIPVEGRMTTEELFELKNKMNTKALAKRRSKTVLRIVANIVFAVVILLPLLYAISIAFMPSNELFTTELNIVPKHPTVQNFIDALRTVPLLRFIVNSFIMAGFITVGQIISCSLAAFSFSFLEFKGKGILFAIVMATMMVPGEATIISNYLTVANLGMLDTYPVLIIPYLTSAMGIFLFRQFYMTFPKSLYESAKLDGCTNLKFIVKILMPLTKSAIGAMAVYTFINAWNMYMWPLLVTGSNNMRTVQIGISMLDSIDSQSITLMIAGVVMIIIPSISIFIVGQKQLIRGMFSGAVKG